MAAICNLPQLVFLTRFPFLIFELARLRIQRTGIEIGENP